MARKVIKVNLELDSIYVHDEGDGWGNAEPYLWTVFFKVDGEGVAVTESLTLSGSPVLHNTPGSHGNLGTTDADEGDNITIPAAIGEWQTMLKPIPTPSSLSALVEDVSGVVGVLAVLMEEDNVSDAGANAGHAALNNAVAAAIQQIVNTRTFTNPNVSAAEIDAFTSDVQEAVKDAIVDQQNFFENLWSWINPDDTVGVKVWVWQHDDLDPAVNQNFSHRWKSEGDWEIFGHITSAPLCPVNALSDILKSKASSESSADKSMEADIDAMREFRNGDYRKLPGLARWFELAESHTIRLLPKILAEEDLRLSAAKLVEWGGILAREPDAVLSAEHVEHARRLLNVLAEGRSRRARIDASRMLAVLDAIDGKRNREAMAFLDQMAPARHPTLGGNPCARVVVKRKDPDLAPRKPPEDCS